MTDEVGISVKTKAQSKDQLIPGNVAEFDYGATESVSHPNNYRDRIFMATVCCCCCAVRAMRHSLQVGPKMRAGDVEGAREASEKAFHYSSLSIVTGLVMYGIIALLLICVVLVLIFVGIDAARGFFW